jgi:hypothetical protein
MSSFHTECEINRSPDDVFAYLTEFNNQPQWETGVLKAQRTPGPIGVGTQVKKMRQTPTGKIEFTSEVTAYDEQKRFFEDVVLDGMAKGSRGRWAVEPTSQGARLSVDIVMQAQGLWKLMLPMITSSTRTNIESAMRQLKAILEQS